MIFLNLRCDNAGFLMPALHHAGIEFNGCSSLAERCGIGKNQISEWKKKGWIA